MSVEFARFSIYWVHITFVVLVSTAAGFSQTITAIEPNSAWQGQTLQVAVSGTDLNFVQGTSTLMWLQQGGNQINGNVTDVQATQVSANVSIPPGALVGDYDVHIGVSGGAQTSLINGFEVIVAPPVLNPPTLISPNNSASLNANPVTFTWTSVPNAVSYGYQIALDANFTNIIHSGDVVSTTVNHPLLNNTYYWRVRTGNIAGTFGAWSALYQFTIGTASTLTSVVPSSGYQGQSLGVTISGENISFLQATSTIAQFEPTAAGNSMLFEFNASTQFNGSDFDFTGSGVLNIPLSAPLGLYDLTYLDPTNQLYTLPNSFTVLQQLPDPATPTLVTPINGVVISQIPVMFDWNDLSNIAEYQIQINTTANFSSPFIDEDDISASAFAQQLPDGQYYWRVRARNLSNVWSAWSNTEDLVLSGTSQLTSLTPNQGYAGQDLNLTISGVNLPFIQATSVVQDIWLNQSGYQIPFETAHIASSSGGSGQLSIPLSAPTGYYNLNYDHPLFSLLQLPNAFFVTEGNEYSGQIFIDLNQNSVFDGGDIPYPNALVSTAPNSSYSISQTNGIYVGQVPTGTFDIGLAPLNYFTVTPTEHTVSFVGSGGMDTGNDFALQPIPGVGTHDMMISMNSGTIRSGRDMTLNITVKNMGTSVEFGQFTVQFPNGMNFVSSTNPNYSVNANTITWSFADLDLTEELVVSAVLFTPTSFQVGQLVDFSGTVTDISTDETPADNTFLLENQVVNSYDPNFKEVTPATYISNEFVQNGEYLNYTVHFQNTGNAEAIDVYILDTFSVNLSLETIQVISASHPMMVNMLNDRIIEFRFDGINLPDSTSNEPESHGHVSYRIKPVSTFQIGDVIQNTGHIYFDFNPAIVTNTTENWIPVGIEDHSTGSSLRVHPNPSSNIFIVEFEEKALFEIFNVSGSLMLSGTFKDRTVLDLSAFDSGIYTLHLSYPSGKSVGKLVKY